ncbi:MAG: polysaccharide deacetylase family protein [Ginsengibacter sp.]
MNDLSTFNYLKIIIIPDIEGSFEGAKEPENPDYNLKRMNKTGSLTISLDMELYWGMRDTQTINSYRENLANVHQVIPRILALFEKYQIHATWAVVGFLFFNNKEELLQNLPPLLPSYSNALFNPYNYLKNNELEEKFHFAPEAISLIKSTPFQEIATHTYSHYFGLEKGQTNFEFREDIDYAIKTQAKISGQCRSIVFPRNQYNEEHLSILSSLGIHYYRGNAQGWLYKPRNYKAETFGIRIIRLADAYFNLTGHNTFSYPQSNARGLKNIPASLFLRPYASQLKIFEFLRFRRIRNAMFHAAKNKENYHIWWHPHNFGKNTNENLLFLEKILKLYSVYKSEYGFESKSISEY